MRCGYCRSCELARQPGHGKLIQVYAAYVCDDRDFAFFVRETLPERHDFLPGRLRGYVRLRHLQWHLTYGGTCWAYRDLEQVIEGWRPSLAALVRPGIARILSQG